MILHSTQQIFELQQANIYLSSMKPERSSKTKQQPKITKQVAQEAYQNSLKNNNRFQVLSTIFQTMKLINDDKRSPGLYTNQINKNISSKMIPSQTVPPRKGPFLDPKAVYPLNKIGAFGVLIRQCTIVEKGIEEREGNGAPKFKQIVDFNNRIEVQSGKNNEKLDWIKDNKQFPFRLILKDKDKKIKGIYFKTKQEADRVRISYVCKLLYKGNFKKFAQEGSNRVLMKTIQNFKTNLILYKNDKKSRKNDRKSNILDQRNSKDNKSNLNNSKMGEEGDASKSQKGYSSDMMKQLIDKDQGKTSNDKTKNDERVKNILKLEQHYKKNLLQSWAKKANLLDDTKRTNDPQQSMRNTKINSMQSKQKPASNTPQPSVSSLSYSEIELLRQSNLLLKPIVTISLYKGNSQQPLQQSKFNTIITKKDPHLTYQLVVDSGSPSQELKFSVYQYQISVRVLDYLTNSEICNERIPFKGRLMTSTTWLTDEMKRVRIKLLYHLQDGHKNDIEDDDNPEGSFLELKGLNQKVIDEIRNFWEKQSIRRGYYNTNKDIKILQIFQLCQQPPKFWSLGLSEPEYKIISLLTSAQKILKFKLPKSVLPILKILQKLYSQITQLLEVFLSLITAYLHPYYFVSQFNRLNKLHLLLGLEGQIELQSKISLQMELLKRIIQIQCEEFVDKMKRRNIGYAQLLYLYIYEMFSKNFKIKVLVQIWNFLFKEPPMIPIYLVLLAAWLIKFYSDKLKKCHRFKEICQVLQSRQTCSAEIVIREILVLREKYFHNPNSTIIESIKDMFNAKPLQQVVIQFYKSQTARLDYKKQSRKVQKDLILQKLCTEIPVQLPKYPSKSYCLHIYFHRLPAVSGSMYIRANNIEYECMNLPKTRYFIIGDVNTEVTLQFINNRSDSYSCKLLCMQGVNRYTVELQSTRNSQVYRVQYICGLFTEGHIEILKKNRKFQHFIGSYVSRDQIFDQFLRPVSQCSFLNGYAKRLQKEDLGKKIKVIFSSGSKNFDEIEFYLRWICTSPITLPQKVKLVRQFAINISNEYFLSESIELQKIFFSIFLELLEFHISPEQFQSYFSDSLEIEFKAPRILKCRLVLPNGSIHKLQAVAQNYLCSKSNTHLHEDILLTELVSVVQKQAEKLLTNFTEAQLNIIYSTLGEVKSIQIPLIKKKTSKDLMIDQNKFETELDENNDVNTAEPQILVTEILPTFSKISTILDFVNHNKSIQSLGKKQQKNVPQSLNMLKSCDSKFKKILLMRYEECPKTINIPFLNEFHELVFNLVEPNIPKNIFLNNLQTDLKTVCTFKAELNFTDNKKLQQTLLKPDFGLYGNLRILPHKTDTIYFSTVITEEIPQPNAKLFVNYGYGTFRWQPCIVLGYFFTIKEKQNNLSKQKKAKKNFLVRHGRSQKIYRDFQLQMNTEVQQNLRLLQNSSPNSITKSRAPIDSTSKRQLGTISSKRNLDSSQGRRNN